MPDTRDPRPARQTVLAFDFGTRRIGVATGNSVTRSAQPLTTLQGGDSEQLWRAIDRLLAEWQPDQLLVGLPNEDHTGTIRAAAEEFGAALCARYSVPLEFVTEHLTSYAAATELKESRRSGRKSRRVKKADIDAVAARLIAEQWLNRRQ